MSYTKYLIGSDESYYLVPYAEVKDDIAKVCELTERLKAAKTTDLKLAVEGLEFAMKLMELTDKYIQETPEGIENWLTVYVKDEDLDKLKPSSSPAE